jgi:branched-chain amino acid transport system permease protein
MDWIVNGILLGGLYGLLSLGTTLIFSVLGMVHFSHGSFVALGAYLAYTFCEFFPNSIAFLGSVLAGALAQVICYFIFFQKLESKGNKSMALVIGLGISGLVSQILLILYGGNTLSLNWDILQSWPSSVDLWGTRVRTLSLFNFAVALLLFSVLEIWVDFSRWGRSLSALAENRLACSLMGIRTQLLYVICFAISGGLAAIAGILYALSFGIPGPFFGLTFGIKSLAISVLGGVGHLRGALVAGLLVGLGESALPGSWAGWKDAIALTCLYGILLFRPQGLLSKRIVTRV